jgi:hypothetical protein
VRHVLLVVGLGLFGCPAVLVEPGNDFPCDFSKPPGERDALCSPGDVCGVTNRCQRFVYEGPQFEGLPTFPEFTVEGGSGTVLHPRLVKGPIDAVVAAPGVVFVHSAEGYFAVERFGVTPVDVGFELPAPEDFADIAVLERPLPPDASVQYQVFARRRSGAMANVVVTSSATGLRPIATGGGLALRASRLRVLGPDRVGLVTEGRTELGTVQRGPMPSYDPLFSSTPGAVQDLVPGLRPAGRPLVVLTTSALLVRGVDGGFSTVASFASDAGLRRDAELSTDETGSVYAVLTKAPERLSTWVAARSGAEIEVLAPWDECRPCEVPRLATPGLDGTGPFVDVLCADAVKRIRGAAITGLCTEESLAPPFDLTQLNERAEPGRPPVIHTAGAAGFFGGGRSGQLWVGSTIGNARPLFMDRVPLDVGQVGLTDGTSPVFALTSAGLFDGRPERGYLAISPDITSRIDALVNQGQGWVIGQNGNLVRIVNAGRASVVALGGPRLVDGRGQPVTRPLRGEAFNGPDGGLVSMLIAADDSLYFVPAPSPSAMPGQLGDVSPVLTPEPSVFIRSLALERAPTGSNGVDQMRGYVVTSRTLYEVKLGGAPRRWTATPLTFSGAEPVEVWFDNPRGGLARAGYRDGTVFTIPGGFQLTEALPGTDGGAPVAVLDYENLGGWPVALTENGLFVARYDALPSGRLDNRFADGGVNKPMTWREVTLPDGGTPWVGGGRPRFGAQPAKLFVLAEPPTSAGGMSQRVFRLIVYLPTQVIEVGRHVRTNVTAP